MLSCHAASVFAELPLTVEDLVTDKGKFKLDLSFAYANVDQTGVSTGEPISVQTGPTSFVQVPTAVGERSSNRDTLVGTLGLRYGITGKTEVLLRTSLDSTFKCNTPSSYEVLPWKKLEPAPI